jgi:hypothetical protein
VFISRVFWVFEKFRNPGNCGVARTSRDLSLRVFISRVFWLFEKFRNPGDDDHGMTRVMEAN